MLIGVPTEIKDNEYRTGLTPGSVAELVHHGHEVLVQSNAGAGTGADDAAYKHSGAMIAATAAEVYSRAELIVKVKEPQPAERAMLRPGQILFAYLHLAPDPEQAHDLIESGAVCIAYETVTSPAGHLPLLTPMSEVAGRLSIQAGAACLERINGGSGKLLGGVPGVAAAHVVIIGGGIVGSNAAMIAMGMRANVTVIDRSSAALMRLDNQFSGQINTEFSTRGTIETWVSKADLLIGSVLIPGAKAPKLVTAQMIRQMNPGSVVVDVAIDQGGCFATSHPTTHSNPTFIIDGVVHYCVANMPGAVPRTATQALNNATLPFVLALANKGYVRALKDDPHLRNGLNIIAGQVTNQQVAESLGLDYTAADAVLD